MGPEPFERCPHRFFGGWAHRAVGCLRDDHESRGNPGAGHGTTAGLHEVLSIALARHHDDASNCRKASRRRHRRRSHQDEARVALRPLASEGLGTRGPLRVADESDVLDRALLSERSKRRDDSSIERIDVARPRGPRPSARSVALWSDERSLFGGAPLKRLRVTERMPAHPVQKHHPCRASRRTSHHERGRIVVLVEGFHPDRSAVGTETQEG